MGIRQRIRVSFEGFGTVLQKQLVLLPINHAGAADQLHALLRILVKLDPDTVRVGRPSLPRVVGSKRLVPHLVAMVTQAANDRVDAFNLDGDVVDVPDNAGIALEDFDERTVAELDVEAEQIPVLHEPETPFKPKPLLVEPGGCLKVNGVDADVCELLDHDLFPPVLDL